MTADHLSKDRIIYKYPDRQFDSFHLLNPTWIGRILGYCSYSWSNIASSQIIPCFAMVCNNTSTGIVDGGIT